MYIEKVSGTFSRFDCQGRALRAENADLKARLEALERKLGGYAVSIRVE